MRTTSPFDRRQMGSGPFTTVQSRRRGIETAIAVIAVYLALAALYVAGMVG